MLQTTSNTFLSLSLCSLSRCLEDDLEVATGTFSTVNNAIGLNEASELGVSEQ